MNISLGIAWEGWSYQGTSAPTFNGELVTLTAPLNEQSVMRYQLAVRPGELIEFSALVQRLSSVIPGTEGLRQAGMAIDFYDAGVLKRTIYENVIRDSLEEHTVTFAVPANASPLGYVHLLAGSFLEADASVCLARPRVSIREGLFGSSRVVGCGRLLLADGNPTFDSSSPSAGFGAPAATASLIEFSAPRLAQQPRLEAHLEYHAATLGLSAKAQYDRDNGKVQVAVISLSTGVLVTPDTLPPETAISITCTL